MVTGLEGKQPHEESMQLWLSAPSVPGVEMGAEKQPALKAHTAVKKRAGQQMGTQASVDRRTRRSWPAWGCWPVVLFIPPPPFPEQQCLELPEARLSSPHFWALYKATPRASLVAQWLRICLPMQGTRVRALVWEDPTCHGATRPVSHNY